MSKLLSMVRNSLAAPVDIAWLAAFRVLFGCTMLLSIIRFGIYGWMEPFFIEPKFHFKYWGFGWVEVPPSAVPVLFWALALLALAIALGLFFRVAALLFAAGFTYLQLIDVATYLNHYYLASLLAFLLAISPAHRAGSLDALRKPSLRASEVPTVWLFLLRFQVGVVYTFAGLAKLYGDWLLHAQPLRIWLSSRTDLPLLGPLFAIDGVPMLMSWAGFLFDTTIAWFLLARRTRPFAYAVVIAFHTITASLFPIGMFPVIMVLSALVFFSPSWPRRLLALGTAAQRRVRGIKAPLPALAAASSVSRARRPLPMAAVVLLAAYCAVQLLMPLRFLAYGGNVRWHEQGMRFSWRVMVREKNGSITYHVRRKSDGRSWYVSPRDYLTPLQEREMAGQPDLILQLAHHIGRDFERRLESPVEVRVDALVSLNGRRMARMIDPDVDLMAVQDGLRKADWILPAPPDPPRRVRPLYAAAGR